MTDSLWIVAHQIQHRSPAGAPLDTDRANVVYWIGDGRRRGPGFYFIDETWDFVGPYLTDGDAAEALDAYCDWLEGIGPTDPVSLVRHFHNKRP